MKLEFIAKRNQKDFRGEDQPAADFKVSLTEGGTSYPDYCFSKNFKGFPNTSMTGTFDYLDCVDPPREYEFNLRTNRFLVYYRSGYLDGKDNNDNTPSMSGGTCTRID